MKKILLIEDNKDVRENTAEMMELSNYEVITASDGREGLDLARQHVPDLIVCDIMMPEMDGYEVLANLSKETATATIPFIFLTAKAERSDVREGMELGADDYLTKPFSEEELLNAIGGRLKKSQMLRERYEQTVEGVDRLFEEAAELNAIGDLSGNRELLRFKKKEEVFREGGYPRHLYLLNKGRIKAWKMHDAGKEYITEIFQPGDFFGHTALMTDSPYDQTAVAMEDSEVYRIPARDFYALIHNNREVSARFIKMLSNNLQEKEERLLTLAYDSVRKRVAEALLYLKDKYSNEVEENGAIPVSRDDLASIVGTAKETVIRTLSDLKEEGLIRVQGRKIAIRAPEKLARIIP